MSFPFNRRSFAFPFHAHARSSASVLALGLLSLSASPAFAGIANDDGQAVAPTAADDAASTSDSADAGTIVVTGRSSTSDAARALDAVPGGTGLVDQSLVEKGRVLTNQDVLAYQPGVYAQAAGGSDGLKISIRGSAVNRGVNFFRTGILFDFDGLPVTSPGGTPYELFEPLGLKYTEILRGTNGFDRGSSFLGGAINYVTKTGKDADLLEARLEGGTYGYLKGQVASGGQFGNVDYYLSGTYSQRNGYQSQSAGDSFGIVGNIGIQITPDIETRFYVRYRQTWNQTPGGLLKSEIENNPRTNDPLNSQRNAVRIQPGSTWIGNKTSFNLTDRSKLSVGFVYHDFPIDIETNNSAIWAYTDISEVVDYERTDTLFGRDSVTRFGILSTDHTRGWQATYFKSTIGLSTAAQTALAGVAPGTLLRFATYDGADRNIHLSNTSEPLPGLKVTLGAALLQIVRKTAVQTPSNYELVTSTGALTGVFAPTAPFRRNDLNYTVRGGLQYALTPDVQLYSNISRSVEPANDWSYLTSLPKTQVGTNLYAPSVFASGLAYNLPYTALPLKDQTAWTAEIGARGTTPIFGHWEISAYRSWVTNELLTVLIDIPNNITAESNASPTIHQGVEVGFDTVLWHSASNPDNNISTRQSYTFNDFHFRHDSVFGTNQLPSLPRHFYQGQVTYNHPSGFYLSADVQAASGYPVDYAVSVKTDSYAIFGATIGYDPKDSPYSLFLDFRNLGNKGYAAAVSPGYNDKGVDQRRSYPGDGFSVVGSISLKLGKLK